MTELRRYTDADYGALLELFADAYAGITDVFAAQADVARVAALLPDAQVVAVRDGRVVGVILALPCRYAAFVEPPPLADIYDPDRAADHARGADSLFALEVLVHRDAGRGGIGRAMHGWIDRVITDHGLRAFLGVSRLPGLRAAGLPVGDYVAAVAAGRLRDPALSFNLAVGMRPTGLISAYFPEDADSLGYGVPVSRSAT